MIQPTQTNQLTPDLQKFVKPSVVRPDNAGGGYTLTGYWVPLKDYAQPNVENTALIYLSQLNISPPYHVALATATEILPTDGTPHAGYAVFYTQAVQLDADNNGNGFVKVVFTQNWNSPLPVGIMLAIG
jgi:hypothetical protein